MPFKFLTILLIIWLIPLTLIAQNSDEETLRIEFVKKLSKRRNSSPDKKDKPNLANDLKRISNTNQTNTDDVIKVETQLVRSDILVSDGKGNAVLGLKPEDFIIRENGVLQEIGTFSLGDNVEVPRTIVLITDITQRL